MDGLFEVLENEDKYSAEQKQANAFVLRELLIKSGQKMFEQADFSKPLPNMLSAVHDKLHEFAKTHATALSNVLINMEASKNEEPTLELQSYALKRPFGIYRFTLTEILSDLLVTCPDILDKLPSAIWSVLSSLFLEYRFNNLYQFNFWRIFQTVVRENHVESLKSLLGKYNFLLE